MTSRTEYPAGYPSATPDPEPDGGLEDGGEARRAEGAEPLLGNLAESFGNPTAEEGYEDPVSRRQAERYIVRDQLRLVTRDERLRYCGAHSIRALGSVDIRRTVIPVRTKKGGTRNEAVVGVSGLASCGRWYTCPFCGAQIAARRRAEIEKGVAAAVKMGLVVAMMTLTVRHSRRHELALLLDALAKGLKAVGDDKSVRKLRREIGWAGYIRVVECTHGQHGWHPHYHFVVFFDREAATVDWECDEVPDELLAELGKATLRAWKAGVVKAGLRAPTSRGYDMRILVDPGAEVAAYGVKSILGKELGAESVHRVSKAAYEMTGSMTKDGKVLPSGKVLSRTTWDIVSSAAGDARRIAGLHRTLSGGPRGLQKILDEADRSSDEELDAEVVDQETGEIVTLRMVMDAVTDDVRLFWELEAAMKGRAMVVWSKGLKSRFGINELTDEEIVEQELSGPESTVMGLTRDGINATQSRQMWHGLKTAVKHGSKAGGIAFADAHGIDWVEPDDPTLVVDRTARTWQGDDARRTAQEQRDLLAELRWRVA